MTLVLIGEGDGGEVTGDKAAKQVTAVYVCNSAFITEKLLDIFDEVYYTVNKLRKSGKSKKGNLTNFKGKTMTQLS